MNYVTKQNSNWSPLANVYREMDSLFESFFYPTLQSQQEEEHYLLSLEVPGIAKDDIKIEVADRTVTISGERRLHSSKKDCGSIYAERRYGKFQRSFSLPVGVDTNKIEASYQDGMLQLAIPKAESAKPRQIKIGNGTSSFFGKLLGDSKRRGEDNSVNSTERIA